MRGVGRLSLLAVTVIMIGGQASPATRLTVEAVNAADFSKPKSKGLDKRSEATVVKGQILLDRAGFSPGVIDGRGGENFIKALTSYQHTNGLTESGKLDQATWSRLVQNDPAPVLVSYSIAVTDVKGPFTPKIPPKLELMAALDGLHYTGPLEGLAEHFHMDQGLLRALNPGKNFENAGDVIMAANVARDEANTRAAKVEVDKRSKQVRAIAKDGSIIAVFPASVGSAEKPAPSGLFKVRMVAHNPIYHYNPKFEFKGVHADKPFTIKPGPNNPVGSVWIDLTADSYGIHGTPEPSQVSKAYSHGCVRLTNWDAERLARLVGKGTPVEFLD
jgi:lipoprotein-anchoring transpeptidase ErfK/SrfK